MTKLNFPNFDNCSNNDTKSYKELKIKRISRKTSNKNNNISFTKNNNDPIMKKLTAERKSRLKMLKDNPDLDVLEITKDCIAALNQYLDSFQEGVENLSNKDDFENIVNGLDGDLDGIFDNFDDLNGDIRMMMDLFNELYMQLNEMEKQLDQIQTDLGYLSVDSPMYDEDKDKLMHDLSVFRNNLNSVNDRIFPEDN